MKKIGELKLKGEVFLAPMADYTNVAFRILAKEYGAALVYTELISSKALTMKSKRTEKMLAAGEAEKPVFLQLFGSNPQDFEKAITIVEKKFESNFAGYDLNCGCSVPKAMKGKYGCSLMNDPKLIGQIINSMTKSTEKPVTIKMRLGLKEETFMSAAQEAKTNGASAITLHPRFGTQGYTGEADWQKIKNLKEKIDLPIIGNGDIKKPADVMEMKTKTNCDFEMVGRAAIGNAFFFKQANEALEGKEITQKKQSDVKREGQRFLELAKEYNLGVNDVRPYFIGLSKGLIGASILRNRFGLSKSIEEIEKIFTAYFED